MQKGMQMTLQAEADMEVVGLAATAEEAIDMINEQSPDVAIVDISLPGMSGIELIKVLSSDRDGLRMLVVSRHEEELFAERAVRAGASGYIMKINAGEQIVDAVRKIASGGIYLSEKISSRMLMNLAGSSAVKKMSPYEMLSDRELSVFRLLGQGKPTRE
ncbi:MAG: response regulator, partial [Bacteroidota bacterium]